MISISRIPQHISIKEDILYDSWLVLSLHEHIVNLVAQNDKNKLLSLTSPLLPLLPFSVQSHEFYSLSWDRPVISFSSRDFLLDFNHAQKIDLSAQLSAKNIEAKAVLYAMDQCRLYMKASFFCSAEPAITQIYDDLKKLPFYMQNNLMNRACQMVQKIIGLGAGLTPSGDDFLCGFLLASSLKPALFTEFTRFLQHHIKIPLNQQTSLISSYFLDYALKNIYAENLWHIRKGVLDNNSKAITQWITKTAPMGHTSGADILLGLYYGLSAISNS